MPITRKLPPVHPGEVLLKEFLDPLGVSQYRLAKSIGVPQPRISSITQLQRRITADTALRLGRFFGTSPEFWLNLQNRFDLETARDELERQRVEITPLDAARPVLVAATRTRTVAGEGRQRATG